MSQPPAPASTTPALNRAPRNYLYYDWIMAGFVCVLLCSNFIGAAKQAVIDVPLLGPIPFSAGILFFPISYIFGDILTEVYGYARDRRVVWAGFGALLFASFMAKMKIWTEGKALWSRTIGSTVVGEAVDSSLFYFIAFAGIWQLEDVIKVAFAQFMLKTAWEILMTPLTYKVVGFLKRKENEDFYDRGTDFNPFKVKA